MLRTILWTLLHIFLILFLTILTQIGGLVYLISLLLHRFIPKWFSGQAIVLFLLLYLAFQSIIVPRVAPLFGREVVKHSDHIKATNYLTILLNRNYVVPSMNVVLQKAAAAMNSHQQGLQIRYLDANFPFWDGFPLLPHISHNDGRKIDLSLMYEMPSGEMVNQKRSRLGYGDFEGPLNGEWDQNSHCKGKGYYQYDFPKYFTLGKINQELQFSNRGTKWLVERVLDQPRVQKIFIEPHLKNRLSLNDSRVRYHGCHAVRHDDHIHVEVR